MSEAKNPREQAPDTPRLPTDPLEEKVRSSAADRFIKTQTYLDRENYKLEDLLSDLEKEPFNIKDVNPLDPVSVTMGIFHLQKFLGGFKNEDTADGCDGMFGILTHNRFKRKQLEYNVQKREKALKSEVTKISHASPEASESILPNQIVLVGDSYAEMVANSRDTDTREKILDGINPMCSSGKSTPWMKRRLNEHLDDVPNANSLIIEGAINDIHNSYETGTEGIQSAANRVASRLFGLLDVAREKKPSIRVSICTIPQIPVGAGAKDGHPWTPAHEAIAKLVNETLRNPSGEFAKYKSTYKIIDVATISPIVLYGSRDGKTPKLNFHPIPSGVMALANFIKREANIDTRPI